MVTDHVHPHRLPSSFLAISEQIGRTSAFDRLRVGAENISDRRESRSVSCGVSDLRVNGTAGRVSLMQSLRGLLIAIDDRPSLPRRPPSNSVNREFSPFTNTRFPDDFRNYREFSLATIITASPGLMGISAMIAKQRWTQNSIESFLRSKGTSSSRELNFRRDPRFINNRVWQLKTAVISARIDTGY